MYRGGSKDELNGLRDSFRMKLKKIDKSTS